MEFQFITNRAFTTEVSVVNDWIIRKLSSSQRFWLKLKKIINFLKNLPLVEKKFNLLIFNLIILIENWEKIVFDKNTIHNSLIKSFRDLHREEINNRDLWTHSMHTLACIYDIESLYLEWLEKFRSDVEIHIRTKENLFFNILLKKYWF